MIFFIFFGKWRAKKVINKLEIFLWKGWKKKSGKVSLGQNVWKISSLNSNWIFQVLRPTLITKLHWPRMQQEERTRLIATMNANQTGVAALLILGALAAPDLAKQRWFFSLLILAYFAFSREAAFRPIGEAAATELPPFAEIATPCSLTARIRHQNLKYGYKYNS